MDQIAPILTAAALVVTAVGGLSLRRRGRERELIERAEAAEGAAHRRLTLLRRLEMWLIETRQLDGGDFPGALREAIQKETAS